MDINEGDLNQLAGFLQKTLDPDATTRRQAEKFLQQVEVQKGYPILLLTLIDKDIDISIRVAGAVTFKNFVKRNWKIDDDIDKINIDDRNVIKQNIVNLMLKSPERIQRQLSDSISVIGKSDFPGKWPTLLPEMVSKFGSGDFHVINGILQTAHSLFKRYRHEFKSNDLWSEIKVVLEVFAKPLTDLFVSLVEFSKQNENNKETLKLIYGSLVTIAKIFNSLNYQDLPEYFEDNMQIWMERFDFLLNVSNPLLATGPDEEPGLLDQLKSQICDNVGMYAQKYNEEFAPFLPKFVTNIWGLLVSTGSEPKFDLLVSKAIEFLAMVAEKEQYKSIFEDPNTMSSICEKVIIPNMEFRPSDEELFEDNPEEYLRRDIEGSDIDTRRRAACDLVRALSKHFEQQITTIFGQYVQAMLSRYAADPTKNWKNKDAAIYLVTSLAAKAQTQKHGITQTNQLFNIMDFYQTQILPDLMNPNVDATSVLKADAIKYVMIFRNQLPPQTMKESIPQLLRFLVANSVVVHTYAAIAIDKILLLRQADKSALIKSTDVAPFGAPLLVNLFSIFDKPGSKENEYAMKAIMRTFSALQEGVTPFMGEILPKLTNTLNTVAKNPSKPHFNHYLFETLSLSIRIMCKNSPAHVTQFEATLFPLFQGILQQDVTEFIPYVFQIFALLLQFHSTEIPQQYMVLFPCLLVPMLWERQGNIPALVKLICSYIKLAPQQVVASDKLNAMLGVFQKLIASKANDHEGFKLIQCMVEYIPEQTLGQYMKPVFTLFFQRLTSSKTVKFIKGLLVFFGIYVLKYGASNLIQMIDGIQPKMFAMVVDRIFIPELQKVSGNTEKKTAAVGITKLLCESEAMFSGEYAIYWPPLLQALIGLFELPEDNVEALEEHFTEIEPEEGAGTYQAVYSQLVFAGKNDVDPLKETIPDAKLYLAQSLGKLSVGHPGKVRPVVSTIAPGAQTYLANYLQLANVQIS